MGFSLGGALKGGLTGFATTGNPWGAAAGAAAGGFLSPDETYAGGAERAAQMAQFNPYSITSGIGTGTFEGGKGVSELDPRFQNLSGLLSGQAETFLGGAAQPQASGIPLYQRGIQQALPFFQQAGATAAQAPGAGFLSQLQEFDPYQAAETQFGRLEEILDPGRERARGSLEARLLSQGRLGSTGGGVQQEGLETAIEQSRRQGLFDAFGQAQQTQQNLLGLGTGLNQQQMQRAAQQQALGLGQAGFLTGAGAGLEGLGLSRQQMQQQLGLGALGGATGLEQMPLDQLRLGGQLGGARASAGAQAAKFPFIASQNLGDTQAALYGGLLTGIGNTDWSNIFGGGNTSGTGDYGAYTDKGYGPIVNRGLFS